MTPAARPVSRREARIGTQLAARGERGLFDALLALRGIRAGGRYLIRSLYAVGGEGAVYLARDTANPAAPDRIAKLPLAPYHKPIQLTSKLLRARRAAVRDEAELVRACGSPFLPRHLALLEFENPLLESARGGAFARPEPCFLMEKVVGQDLDAWLCRVHRGGVAKAKLKPTLDRLCVGVLQALVDLERRGYLYADLRPGNLRVCERPRRRVRFVDAGSCVPLGETERFPHVPSYLPPDLFRDGGADALKPTPAVTAVMAGRTLSEICTGQAPKASRHIDMMRLLRAPVSPPVAEVVAGLADGSYPDCAGALETLASRARKRVTPR